jgi:hypothetical protein
VIGGINKKQAEGLVAVLSYESTWLECEVVEVGEREARGKA